MVLEPLYFIIFPDSLFLSTHQTKRSSLSWDETEVCGYVASISSKSLPPVEASPLVGSCASSALSSVRSGCALRVAVQRLEAGS